jgi:crotonobetainyl-CoA:carnitine CoA-transferase CaiB-like acyl-CoA transferase
MSKLPLDGIRVIDMTVVFSGPFGTWLLAALGAEVIRVDSIHHQPDMARAFSMWPTKEMLEARTKMPYPDGEVGEAPWNRHALFNRVAWNKRSCCINLADVKGKEIFKKLIGKSDVFIENNSAKAMDHLELGPAVLMKVNPRLVCINMPSYGRTGPYSDYVGWGDNAEALTGHGWVRGYDDDSHPISNNPVFHMDSTGGTGAALAAILGLQRRKKTGKGVAVDFAQIESMMPQLGEIYMDYAWNGRNQRTMGNRHPTAVQGCYRCRGEDRWINITLTDEKEWQGLCRAMRNPEWMRRDEFSDHARRYENHDEFDRLVEEFTVNHDNFELFHLLQGEGVPAGPAYTEKDTYNDPQLNARGFFETIAQEDCGAYRYPGFLWKMSRTPPKVKLPPCRLGEHNDYVFREILNLPEKQITELEEEQIIGGNRYTWA